MKPTELAVSVGVVVAGVLIAGYIMSTLRGSIDLIATAHGGYDS